MEKLAQGYGLIEGPVWDPERGLLFSDVLFGGVHCLREDGTVETVFAHRRGIGGMALHEDGGLMVTGRNVSFKSFAGGATRLVLDSDPDNDNVGCRIVGYNDLTTDSAGRIYVGSLGSSPVFDDGLEPVAGALFLIDLDGSARRLHEGIELTNGLGTSPDGSRLYHSDSRTGAVWVYEIQDDGGVSERRRFASVRAGSPDGLAVAEDGSVWVALAHGSGVAVYDPSGEERSFLPCPQPMVTSLCFGGEGLRDLYVVTGSGGTDSEKAGSIFRIQAGVPGLPVSAAKVCLPEA